MFYSISLFLNQILLSVSLSDVYVSLPEVNTLVCLPIFTMTAMNLYMWYHLYNEKIATAEQDRILKGAEVLQALPYMYASIAGNEYGSSYSNDYYDVEQYGSSYLAIENVRYYDILYKQIYIQCYIYVTLLALYNLKEIDFYKYYIYCLLTTILATNISYNYSMLLGSMLLSSIVTYFLLFYNINLYKWQLECIILFLLSTKEYNHAIFNVFYISCICLILFDSRMGATLQVDSKNILIPIYVYTMYMSEMLNMVIYSS